MIVLPPHIADLIAAGEVVSRPASVVKELMENSVDAGADKVDVIVTDSGRTLIQVIDNGSGMSPDDAVLCFERHATSKIATAEDLQAIGTFGFRGEALASIAAVAEVTLRTRRKEDECGCEVEMSASRHLSTKEVQAPCGSNFAVRNLFFNVPARRKFLKSDKVEFKHIVEEFTRVALTRPEVSFTLRHNGSDIFVLNKAQSLKFRIQDLMGAQVASDLVDIEAQTTVVKLSGFLGRPSAARKTPGNQFFFVNGRYFRSPYLHKAVLNGYEGMIPEGVSPSYFLYFEVDPGAVDVNIHPTKAEVRFEDDSIVFQVVSAAVRETLGRNSFGQGIDFESGEARDIPVFGRHFGEYSPASAPVHELDPSYDPFKPAGPYGQSDPFSQAGPFGQAGSGGFSEGGPGYGKSGSEASPFPEGGYSCGTSKYVSRSQDYGPLFEEGLSRWSKVMVTPGGRYLLSPVSSGVMVVNVRRARERVLYDRFLEAVTKEEHVSQQALFPVQVQVGTADRLLFDDNADLLASLGFDIAPFGNDTIVVNGVPEGYSAEPGKVQEMVYDLLRVLSDEKTSLPQMMASATAEKFAKLGAYSSSDTLSLQEASALLDALLSSSNAEFTPSGKKILQVLADDDFEKMFRI